MSGSHARARGPGSSPLRIATHNVRGVKCHIPALAAAWVAMHLDIVLLQETHVGFFEAAALARQVSAACKLVDRQHAGFTAFWGLNTGGNATRSAGVAILVRKHLLDSGAVVLDDSAASRSSDGRLIALPLRWGGHLIMLASVYLPNDSVGQQSWLSAHLPQFQQGGASVLLGGDFNFVEDQLLDRGHVHGVGDGQHVEPSQAAALPPPHQLPAARALRAVLPSLHDVFRHLHPARRSFTWHSTSATARLDRWYAVSELTSYITQCWVGDASPSDHRPVVVDLLPKISNVVGPGLRRVRLQGFWSDTAAKQDFMCFLQQQAAQAPQLAHDDASQQQQRQAATAFLQWWPQFKSEVICTAAALCRRVRAAAQHTSAGSRQAAADGLALAYAHVEAATSDAQMEAALQQLAVARQAWCAAVNADRAAAAWRCRREWLHQGERPSPGITAALQGQQPPQSRYVAGLRSEASGRVVTAGRPMAQLVGQHWANICKATDVDESAVQQVLSALQASGLRLDQEHADVLGAVKVSVAEVNTALKHSAPGKAPGLDGLPVDLYRKCSTVCAPLLASLYTAMGVLGEVPVGFLDGVVVIIYKSGPRVHASNYRPITLLNTDYRVLAKVLAYRLRKVQPSLIESEQTAFLPGRHIGENIMLIQLLPSAIGPNSHAATVFLDFYKAYDTVARPFLFSVLEAVGLGGGFLRWVKLLLVNTQACALVNGYRSAFYAYSAGVRQGCPLAPQLYLFVAQALLSFLKQHGFGVRVASGRLITAGQFADDAQVFLDSIQQISAFLSTMAVFKAASGQGLNMDKTLVLPVGREARVWLWSQYYIWQHAGQAQEHTLQQAASAYACHQLQQSHASVPPDARVHGLRVVDHAKSLGLVFRADGNVVVDWDSKLDKVLKCFQFISALPLSAFGRGFASASYGISKLLYAAEFAGMPPAAVVDKLHQATAKLVDRQQAPGDARHKFPGVAGTLLVGHPRSGGFGALPWQQHILARHAVWAVRLMQGSDQTPWVHVARLLLVPAASVCPAWAVFAIALCQDERRGPTSRFLPAPLVRLVLGFRSLPQWRVVDPPVAVGDWCANAPLWCNPLLVQGHSELLPVRGLEDRFADLAELSTLTTVQHAMSALSDLQRVQSTRQYQAVVLPFWFKGQGYFADWQLALQRVSDLVAAIPESWRTAAAAAPAAGSRVSGVEVVQSLMGRIGWGHPLHPGQSVKLLGLTVKDATVLQMQPVLMARQMKHDAFLEDACQGVPAPHVLLHMQRELKVLFDNLWGLQWDNARKELFWRLAVDGLPTSARMHMLGESCACGAVAPGRLHHYWECPVAQAVIGVVNAHLPMQQGVSRCHLWLSKVPGGSALHSGVWMVVCQAALGGMDKGRRTLTALDLGATGSHGVVRVIPPAARLNIASKVAVATFWDLLQDYVGMATCPGRWLEQVGAAHPFLHVCTSPDGSRRLHVRRS